MRVGLDLRPFPGVRRFFHLFSRIGRDLPRLAEIQGSINAQQGEFGLALIGTAAGTLVSLTFGSMVVERLGHRVILVLIPFLTALYALASFANSPLALFLLLLPCGLTIGCIEIVINLEADRAEHQLGRRIVESRARFWSLGFFTAGLIGAGFAQFRISPQLDLIIMVPVILIGTLLLLGKFEPAPHRATAHAAPASRFASPTMAIIVLVILTISAMILEGAGADWSAIYMRDVFHAAPFVMGFAAAAGAMMQALTRFFANGFVERYSPIIVARTLLAVQFIGALAVFFAPNDVVALVGLGVIGIGTSVIFPLAMSAAAQRSDRPAVTNVAALAQISFLAFLLGPPLLGFIAQSFGVRWSFGIGLPLVVLSFLATGVLGSRATPATIPEPVPGK